MAKRQGFIQLTTGSKAPDGGIEAGSLRVVWRIQGGKCKLIDSEGTFKPQRLVEIAKHYRLDQKYVLSNVAAAKCFNTDHQTNLVSRQLP